MRSAGRSATAARFAFSDDVPFGDFPPRLPVFGCNFRARRIDGSANLPRFAGRLSEDSPEGGWANTAQQERLTNRNPIERNTGRTRPLPGILTSTIPPNRHPYGHAVQARAYLGLSPGLRGISKRRVQNSMGQLT